MILTFDTCWSQNPADINCVLKPCFTLVFSCCRTCVVLCLQKIIVHLPSEHAHHALSSSAVHIRSLYKEDRISQFICVFIYKKVPNIGGPLPGNFSDLTIADWETASDLTILTPIRYVTFVRITNVLISIRNHILYPHTHTQTRENHTNTQTRENHTHTITHTYTHTRENHTHTR